MKEDNLIKSTGQTWIIFTISRKYIADLISPKLLERLESRNRFTPEEHENELTLISSISNIW